MTKNNHRHCEAPKVPKQSPWRLGDCFVVASLLLAMTLFGCMPITVSEEQKTEILKNDPGFQKVLEEKAALDAKLAGLRSDFLSEKNIYESKVMALRKEFEAKKAQFYSKNNQIKSQLNPQREKISQEVAIVTEELKNKQKASKAVNGMLNQAKAVIEGQPAQQTAGLAGKFSSNIPEQDKIEWQKRFESLREESRRVGEELASIKAKLYVLKLKQRSLIQ